MFCRSLEDNVENSAEDGGLSLEDSAEDGGLVCEISEGRLRLLSGPLLF